MNSHTESNQEREISLLLIEDDPGDKVLLDAHLMEVELTQPSRVKIRTTWARDLRSGLARIAEQPFDVILCDLELPDSRATETIQSLAPHSADAAYVLLSGMNDEALALKAVKLGFQDYLVKGSFEGPTLHRTISYAIERKRAERRQAALANVELTTSSADQLGTVLDGICQVAADLLPSRGGGAIFLWDEDNDYLRSAASSGSVSASLVSFSNQDLTQILGAAMASQDDVLIVSDLSPPTGRLADFLDTLGAASAIFIRLGRDEGALGHLMIVEPFARSYALSDIHFLQALSHRVSRAVVATRLAERERYQKQLSLTLREVGNILNASLSPTQVLQQTLDYLLRVLSYDNASIILIEENEARVAVSRGNLYPQAFGRIQMSMENDQILQSIRESREPLIVEDTRSDLRFRGFPGANQLGPWIGVPLLNGHDFLGILTIEERWPRRFNKRIYEFLSAFAYQASLALVNARLYNQSQLALSRTDVLYTTIQELVSQRRPVEILRCVAGGVTRAVESHWTIINTLDSENRYITALEVDGPGARDLSGFTYDEFDVGLTGWVLRNRKAALSSKSVRDPRESPEVQKRRNEWQVGSIAVVPLMYEDRVLGTLTALRHISEADFVESDVRTMEALANQAAIALENARLLESAQKEASTDSLTGLNNRRRYLELCQKARSEALSEGSIFSVLMIDIDHFKVINDMYGHQAGDDVLKQVAKRLKESLRPCDIVGRYGGEEFAVLLPNADGEEAAAVAQWIRWCISSIEIGDADSRKVVTASIGVAQCCLTSDLTLVDLMDRADQALYLSKQNGRNQVTLWQTTELVAENVDMPLSV